MELQGKNVVVIGGSAGIGFAVAKLAVEQGANVRIGSHDAARLKDALSSLGDGAQGDLVDVADDASCAAFFAAGGPIDHFVYTAGDWVRRNATFGTNFSLESAMGSFDIRLWGLLRTINAALPRLSDNASICLTGGLAAHRPQKGQAMSSAVTGAVEHLTKALAVDLAPIRVNIVVPGFIATDVWKRMPQEMVDAMVEGQPLTRQGLPEEAAEAYVGLMRSTYTTGQSVIVDGGMMLT